MKLIEVVILTGMQCISPVQNQEAASEAGKVWCAIVVEKDTDSGWTKVTPPSGADNPEVKLVLQRFENIGKPATGLTHLTVEPEEAAAESRLTMAVPDAPDRTSRIETQAETQVPRPIPRPAMAEPATAEPAMAEAEGADQPVDQSTDQIETPAAADEPAPPAPEAKKPATKLKKKSTKKAKSKKTSGQCSGSMKPVWYTNKDGKRKYRCRRSLY